MTAALKKNPLDLATAADAAAVDAAALAARLVETLEREKADPTPAKRAAVAKAWAELDSAHKARTGAVAVKPEDARSRGLVAHSITMADVRTPPVEHMIVGSIFPFGKASVIYGPSGAGKSTFLSQLAFKVASGGGGTFLGMHMHDQEGGPVLVYSAEDTLDDWKRKAAAVHQGCGGDINIERALERFRVIENVDGAARLTEIIQVREDLGSESRTQPILRATLERLGIIEEAKKLGARLVIIETASRLIEKEDNPDMTALQAACGHIAATTGAAVVISHHPTKNSSRENDSRPESARGGGALIANSRNAVSIFPADEAAAVRLLERGLRFNTRDLLELKHQKGSSSVPIQEPILVVRGSTPFGAVLKLPEEIAQDPQMVSQHAARADRDEKRKAEQLAVLFDKVAELKVAGAVSKYRLRPHDPALGCSKNEVDALVDAAFVAGVLVADRRDTAGRVLDIGLGLRPQTPRATFCEDRRIPADDA